MNYRAPIEECFFVLRHAAGVARLPQWDDEMGVAVTEHAAQFIEGVIAPLDEIGDRASLIIEQGRVRLPEAFVDAYREYRENGWPSLSADEAWDGQELPAVLDGVLKEMLAGACLSFQMILGLTHGAQRVIEQHGSEAQRQRHLPRLVSGEWLATMCLTEPEAGSDLGRIRCLAQPDGEGGWQLTGEKIFISGGDHSLTDGILHLVLARTSGAPAGTRGLSLFLCPALLEQGQRNAIDVLRLEEKMGMHASPTCHLHFDGAQAELVGELGSGLATMFTMMNAARLDTALQGVGQAQVATQRAWDYARERVQGKAPAGQPATLAQHPDVQRMLLRQATQTLGTRALVYWMLVEHELDPHSPLVEFLTPVCKAFATTTGIEVAQLAIQVHGGYGYLREYRVEQVLRDVRVTALYEGTNGIQAMTLATRLLTLKDGRYRQAFEDALGELAQTEDTVFSSAREAWRKACDCLLVSSRLGAAAQDFLTLTALLATAVCWARMQRQAEHFPSPARLTAMADYFRTQLLSEAGWLAERIETASKTDLDDTLFTSVT